MSESVKLPALGESVTEGTVTRWLKQVGETVEVDEPLLEVSTDKVDTEIPSPVAGTVEQILVQEDETAEVGATLAVIGDGSGAAAAPAAPTAEAPPAPAAPPAPEPVAAAPAAAPAAEAAPAASPADGTPVTLPALGESVTEGTVTRWLKQVGETVEVDEPLLEVSTDKVDTEIPSPVAGTVQQILVQEDETAEVGATLAVVGSGAPAVAPAAPAPAAAPAPVAAPTPVTPSAPAAAPAPATPPAPAAETDDASPYVTPLVRKLAKQHDIDLSTVTGTGVGGRIRKQDVLDAAEKAAAPAVTAAPATTPVAATPAAVAAPQPSAEANALRGTTEKMSRLRKVIAKRMVESLQVSAQLTTVVEADITKIAHLRDRAKKDFAAREGVKLSYLPFFALAAVEALKVHPKINSSIEGDNVVYHAQENLSVAVDTDRGLLVPVIKDAGELNIAGLSRKIADLAERTRTNQVTPDELSGGTFTLTNTGSRGALFDTPIINQPQVAILGTGTVVKKPVVVKGEDGGENIAIRSTVYLALSYDHRIVDGADAARFLTTIKERLEEGKFESDLGL